ncbi:MAG: FecR domain-containing protein [Pseudomonadota bacterium]
MSQSRSRVVPLRTKEAIEAEAAAWLAILGREQLSRDDREKFLVWQAASQANKDAFEALSGLWDDLAVLKDLDDLAEATPKEVLHVPPRFSRRWFAGVAASLAVVTGIGAAAYSQLYADVSAATSFATLVGEQKTLTLEDGSIMQLNTDSRADVRFTPQTREIILVYGEAHFDVAKSQERPFVVKTSQGEVRATGTAFTVRTRGLEAFEVTVEEGSVAVAASLGSQPGSDTGAQAKPEAISLSAGQNAVIEEDGASIAVIKQSDLIRKLSWRQGLLAYSGETLAEVVDDVSRYTDIDIQISDPELSQRQIGGHFRVGDLEALFDALEMTFGLKVERAGPKTILLSAAS